MENTEEVESVLHVEQGLEVKLKGALSESDIRDVIALFKRYGLDMTALAVFAKEPGNQWLADPKFYWHELIFPENNK